MGLLVEILLMIMGAGMIYVGGKSQVSYSRRVKANEPMGKGEVFKTLLKTIGLSSLGMGIIAQFGPLYRWL